VERQKLTDDIDVSINMCADLFAVTTDHIQQFVINISVTHEEGRAERDRKAAGHARARLSFVQGYYPGTQQCSPPSVFNANIY
jgi:hypothetical protein